MNITATDIRWMLVHSTSSLPYVLVMCYLVWVHIKAIRQGTKRTGPALVTAFLITLVTAGAFIFNQAPFRFMVSQEANALVKDIALVVQAFLLTVLADQLRDIKAVRTWAIRAGIGLFPILHSAFWYLNQESVTHETYPVVRVPVTITLYALIAYAYSWKCFYTEQKRSQSPQILWRLRTLLYGLTAIIIYILGRGTMEFATPGVRTALVWANRLGLTFGTIYSSLGMAMPRWYVQFGVLLYVIRHGGRHFDNMIGLLSMVSDREIAMKNDERTALRDTATWIARMAGYGVDSVKVVRRVAMLSPISPVPARVYVPISEADDGLPQGLTNTVILYSRVYEVLQAIQTSAPGHPAPEAEAITGATLYLEGRTDSEIRAVCSSRVADAVLLLRVRVPS